MRQRGIDSICFYCPSLHTKSSAGYKFVSIVYIVFVMEGDELYAVYDCECGSVHKIRIEYNRSNV